VSRPHNLLLVFADQMRGQDMACAGNPQLITPSLDRLASEGVQCTNAISNCPVCTPSRGTLLTGLHPTAHGAIANDVPVRTDLDSLGTVLKGAGYKTGYVGKWHLDGVPRERFTPPGPRRLGFDDYWAVWNCHHQYFKGRYFLDTDEVQHFDGYEPDGQTDLCIEFIEKHREEPFALVLSWGPPHAPYELVPERYLNMYDPDQVNLRPNVDASDPEKWRTMLARYYAAITALDADMGRLLEALDRLGLADDTLVVFTSDHGDMLGSQNIEKKEKPWEESISIPLIMRAPGLLPTGQRSDTLTGVMDMMPTMLDLLGVDSSAGMHGRSVAPLLQGRGGDAPESVPIGIPIIVDQGASVGLPEWRGVRTMRYTYTRLFTGEGWVLYDNQEDPYQQNNLIDDSSRADVRAQLDALTDQWLTRLDDPFLPWEDMVRRLDLVDLWNDRERYMHREKARLLG